MNVLEIYQKLTSAQNNSNLTRDDLENIWAKWLKNLTNGDLKSAKDFKTHLDDHLPEHLDIEVRLNRMLDLFWQEMEAFQLTLAHPNALIARSQDGSRAVVLPIHKPIR